MRARFRYVAACAAVATGATLMAPVSAMAVPTAPGAVNAIEAAPGSAKKAKQAKQAKKAKQAKRAKAQQSAQVLTAVQVRRLPGKRLMKLKPQRLTPKTRQLRQRELQRRVVKLAKQKKRQGGQYVAGASRNLAFDCSGFTKVVYNQAVGVYLPHYSGAQMSMKRGKRVSKSNLRPGDLLFWGRNGSQHVSMYIGKGKMIGANNPRSDIKVESINAPWWRSKYAGARRVIL